MNYVVTKVNLHSRIKYIKRRMNVIVRNYDNNSEMPIGQRPFIT